MNLPALLSEWGPYALTLVAGWVARHNGILKPKPSAPSPTPPNPAQPDAVEPSSRLERILRRLADLEEMLAAIRRDRVTPAPTQAPMQPAQAFESVAAPHAPVAVTITRTDSGHAVGFPGGEIRLGS